MAESLANVHIITGDQQPLTAAQIEQVMDIVCAAFGPKLTPYGVSHQTMRAILLKSMNPAYGILALRGDEVVGVLGQSTHAGHLIRFGWRTLWRHLPAYKALLGGLALCIEQPLAPNELRIEPLAVAASQRGQGIGSQLLRQMIVRAPALGFTLLSLDVVDSNVGAQRLYQRFGFACVSIACTGWLTRRAGFRAVHHMQRHLDHYQPIERIP